MNDIVFESAHATGQSAMALPSATPGIIDARDGADSAPPAAASAALDEHKTPHDPSIHETDPLTGLGRLTRDGAWKKKRGNGSRAASGKPLAGATKGKLVIPASEGVQVGENAPASQEVAIPPGATVSSVAETPAPESTRTMEEFEGTAVGVSQGIWALFRSAGGPAWEPDKEEERAWARAIQRVWFHYQLPLVGPLIELAILSARSVAKRSGNDGSGFRRFVAGCWRWARGGKFRDDQPKDGAAAAGAV